MKKNITVLCLLVFCIPFISLAHPGHGETGGYTITHYFTEPVHAVISLGVLIAIFIYTRYNGRNKQTSENS